MFNRIFRYLRRWKFILIHRTNDQIVLPMPSCVDFLQAHSRIVKGFLTGWYEDRQIELLKRRYARNINRIRRKWRCGEKIRVLFLMSCPSKWKCQKLYDLLNKDVRFDPVIGLSDVAFPGEVTVGEICAKYQDLQHHFEGRGCKCIKLFNPRVWYLRTIHRKEADIVFYPEPWYKEPNHAIAKVSKFALTAYVQYFVPTTCQSFHCQLPFHREIFWHFVFSHEVESRYLTINRSSGLSMAGEIISTGNPILDEIDNNFAPENNDKRIVIYAPHWTVNLPGQPETDLKISTFLETGRFLLDYAKVNQNVEWIFKPHPALKSRLVSIGIMDMREVEEYYKAWNAIGLTYETGDYFPLFMRSSAMITDCDSFLNEYGATGKPLIHLISPKGNLEYSPELKSVYETYYQANNITELKKMLELVIEHGEDPNKEARHMALASSGLLNRSASVNIYNHLKTSIDAL